MKFHDQQMLGQ